MQTKGRLPFLLTAYRNVAISGLPRNAGHYFIIVQEDLYFVDLSIEDGKRAWSMVQNGTMIDESSIRMWKRVQFDQQ
jgi:hypothetical protein